MSVGSTIFIVLQAKLTETMNEYKKANNASLDADVQKTCSEKLKKLLMAKMGKGRTEG